MRSLTAHRAYLESLPVANADAQDHAARGAHRTQLRALLDDMYAQIDATEARLHATHTALKALITRGEGWERGTDRRRHHRRTD